MTCDQPGPADIILHRCGGVARLWADPAYLDDTSCAGCRGPLLPEQPHRTGHAAVWCGACARWVGLCAREELDGLLVEAGDVVGGRVPAGVAS